MFKVGDIVELQVDTYRYRALVVALNGPGYRAEIISNFSPSAVPVFARGFKVGNIIHIADNWAEKWKLLA